jgi:hypothetical protein
MSGTAVTMATMHGMTTRRQCHTLTTTRTTTTRRMTIGTATTNGGMWALRRGGDGINDKPH